MSWELVAQEAAKAVAAQAGGVVVAGAGQIGRALLRRLGVLPRDPEELRRLVLLNCEQDPRFAAELAADLAAVSGTAPLPTVLPPAAFFDRTSARARLAVSGTHLVAGAYGVGKTALVLQVCQDVAAEFPGGVAYIDLDAFRTGEALRIAEVQAEVLRQLDVGDSDDAPAELSGQYLRALTVRRFVLVLENAVGAEELRDLVQPWPASLVLVTTRRLTDDLRAWASPLILHGLDDEGARGFLASRCPGAVEAEPAAAAELLDLCDRVPFAILQASVLLGRRRGSPFAVAEVRDYLAGSADPGELIVRCLSQSVSTLPAHAVDDLTGLAALPVANLSHEAAEVALGRHPAELIDAGLLMTDAGRIRLPRLVRDHALRSPAPGSEDVFDRLLGHYRDRAVAADFAVDDDRLRCYPIPPGLRRHQPGPAPLDWLETEAAAIAAIVPRAYHTGRHVEIIQLCGALEPLLTNRGHHGLIAGVNDWGVLAAQAIADPLALSRIHAMQGRIFTQLNLLDRAAAALAEAERVLPDGDDPRHPRARSSLTEFFGRLAAARGEHAAAADAFRRCLIIDEQHDLRRGAGIHRRMLAAELISLGRPGEALEELGRALALTKDLRNSARVRTVGARAFVALGDLPRAAAEVGEARRLAETAGARSYEVEFADIQAEIAWRGGDPDTARRRWGWIAQGYWDAGDRRFDDYLAKLNRLPPSPR